MAYSAAIFEVLMDFVKVPGPISALTLYYTVGGTTHPSSYMVCPHSWLSWGFT